MKPPPVDFLEVTGINGILTWPESNVISHVQPESITLSWVNHEFIVELESGSDNYKFNSLDGVVNIPASSTAGAIDNHATLTVYVNDDEQFGGIITFLPKEESEPFPVKQAIMTNGGFYSHNRYRRTDFIDVRMVERVIYVGSVRVQRFVKVFGYDNEKNPVKILLGPDENDSTPVPVDFEGVSYIVASHIGTTGNLTLYYKDRRRR